MVRRDRSHLKHGDIVMPQTVKIHFIEHGDEILAKPLADHVPRVGDEVRFGGAGNEKYYTVDLVVWVYDEPDTPFDRVNIGVTECDA
jgi:hypothetical protein